jgi:hypothetical protein
MRAFETADQAAGSAAAMLADGERLSRLWRYVFAQMLDDYTSVLRHAGVGAAAGMWSGCPRETGDGRVDAAFAAMAEYLARRDGWTVPSWAALPEREAWPWWFVTDLRGLHPRALVESPSSFRRRGVSSPRVRSTARERRPWARGHLRPPGRHTPNIQWGAVGRRP